MADNNYEIDVTLEETFGTGVRSVEQTATSAKSGGMNEITVTLTNDQENKFYIMNGLAGKDGRDGGFPVAVGEASLMTDTSKIYLYVGIEEGYTQNHLYYWDGEAWHDYGTYGAPADYLRSASVTHGQGLDQLGNTTYTADTLTLEGNADGVSAETEFVQKLYYSAGENVDGALTQKATSEAIESAQYLPIVNHPNAPVGSTDLSVELQQNVMNVIGGVGYAFTTITMTLATKKADRVNRYFGRFTTGGNAFAVTWPTGVTVPSALSYKTQTTYDFVIEDSILHVWEDGNAVGDVLDATATANAVSTWLTNHPEATTTVADGSITTAKLASGVIDQTLTVQGAAADSAKVGQELSDLKSQIEQSGGGISTGAVNQLISILQHGLYDADQTSAILQLRALLLENVPATITYALTGVTSSNSSTSVTTGHSYTTTLTPTDPTYTMTNVSVVMSDIDVTSSVYNSTTGEISIDAVSGSVVITAEASYVAILYNWDFTNSLTDTLQNKTAVIKSGVTQSEAGIQFTATKQYVALHSSLEMTGKTIEIDVSDSSDFGGTGAHGRLVAFSTSSSYNTDSAASTFCWNYSQHKWMFYKGSAWDSNSLAGVNYFKGKTLRIYIPSTKIPTVSVAPIGSNNFETVLTSAGALSYTKGVVMGSSGTDNLVGMIITGVRIYEGDIS